MAERIYRRPEEEHEPIERKDGHFNYKIRQVMPSGKWGPYTTLGISNGIRVGFEK